MDLEEFVRTKKVIVCVGSGGVGKTTLSAAIALKAAEFGLTVCVVTVDPARRLADAMGVANLTNVAARVEPLATFGDRAVHVVRAVMECYLGKTLA